MNALSRLASRAGRTGLLRIALDALLALLTGVVFFASVVAQAACPPDCAGQTLSAPNFSHQNLANANFQNATLVGAIFFRANLNGARFDGAHFQSIPGQPTQTPDFSFADLTNASFAGAEFFAPTYFTYATLTCTDFSNVDMTNHNPVFGDSPLIYTASSTCRTKFVGATMNCEFVDAWHDFDLTNANISACIAQLAGRNFAHSVMGGVNFENAILDGATFTGADLTLATLNGVSAQCATVAGAAQCVDFTGARLQGAKLNNANLTGASFNNAFLSNNVNGQISQAASVHQAHLKNVNLAFAQLSGVDFTSSNFYGNVPSNNANGCSTSSPNYTGFTLGCATAHGATMTGTVFTDAYLYGADFSNTAMAGVNFGDAVLVGANFAGATIGPSAGSGAATAFLGALLQGTNLDQATSLSGVDLTNAFVDFRSGGNLIYINLDGTDHNSFACSTPSTCAPASGTDVCVWVRYPITTVPVSNTTITCPDGTGGPCGQADPSGGNQHWNSKLTIGLPPDPGPPPAWYANAATYTTKAADGVICKGLGPSDRTINW